MSDAPANPDTPTPGDSTPNVPAKAEPKRITRMRLSPDRLDKYVEILSITGSHMEASRLASFPNDTTNANGNAPGYPGFLRERKSNPDFARRCDEAMQAAIGRAESELARRMYLPTERASISKDGTIVHISRDFRNADLLLQKFLTRHRPDEWADRSRLDSNVTTNSSGSATSGAAYVITPGMLSMLSDSDRLALGEILCRAEDARLRIEAEKKQQNQLEGPHDAA